MIFALGGFAQLAFMSLLGVWGTLLVVPVVIVVSKLVATSSGWISKKEKSKPMASSAFDGKKRKIGFIAAAILLIVGMVTAIVGALVTTEQTPRAVRVVLGLPGLLAYAAGMYLWVITFRGDTKHNAPTQGPFRTGAPPNEDTSSPTGTRTP